MNKGHILFCANSAWNLVNFRFPLMKHLAAQGYRISAAAPHDEYADTCREAGFDFYPYKLSRKGVNPFADTATWMSLIKIFRQARPDLVCNFTVKPNIYGTVAAAKLKIPTINNVSGLGTVFIRHSPVTRLVKLMYRYSQRRAEKVFFQNDDDLAEFVENGLVAREKAEILPGSGIDLELFSLPDGGRYSGSNVQSTCSFLLVGRMLADKGVREYVEAARIISAERNDGRFLLLGPLDEHNRSAIGPEELKEWTISGVVKYLGASDDVRGHITAADCVVLPSYREGTPRTLLEAAATGKPIVTTDVPGCRQVVEDGVTGYLCKPYSPDSLAAAIRKILNLRPRERFEMGLRGREKMEREYDQQLVFDAYRRVIEKCIDKGAGRDAAGDGAAGGAAGWNTAAGEGAGGAIPSAGGAADGPANADKAAE